MMATIVQNTDNGSKYFLIGTGLGLYKATMPSFFGGNLFPKEEEGVVKSVVVCDSTGRIFFLESNKLKVIEIDGVPINEMGKKLMKTTEQSREYSYNLCPGCKEQITNNDQYCPTCGLKLR